jgi:hypothetical protein
MYRVFRAAITTLASVCLLAMAAAAQGNAIPMASQYSSSDAGESALPDAPSSTEAVAAFSTSPATGEILASDPYEPLTRQRKWTHFVHRTYSPATFLGAAEDTAFTRVTAGFLYCCGAGAWGEQYAATLADGESRAFFGNFLFPVLLHQDPRYFPKRTGNMFGRAWYAATRVLITRNDNGSESFNYSEVMGAAFSKALCNAYYPNRYRGGWDTTTNVLGALQGDATSNLLREFWPDIRKIVHKHTPQRFQSLEARLPATPGGQY